MIGKQCSSYEPPTARCSLPHEDLYGLDAQKELQRLFRDIPKDYLDVFENVVRWGHPAGVAGMGIFGNVGQATASAKTIVGFVASMIAAREGY